MWNENAPLELLAAKSKDLTEENLSEIQNIIDWDKYINSSILHMDLCGSYAPFCDGCDKSAKYPCAMSYIKMKQAEGMDITLKVAEEQAEPVEAVAPVEPAETEQQKRIGKIRITIKKYNPCELYFWSC